MKRAIAEAYRDIDFSPAKRGAVIPIDPGKTKISIYIDNAVIEHFRAQVERAGTGNYQTLMNDALMAFIHQQSVIDAVRQVVREELHMEDALLQAEEVVAAWIEASLDAGQAIPKPWNIENLRADHPELADCRVPAVCRPA